MTDSKNLELWQSVQKTPVEHTKQITGKSYNGHSPKPHYMVMKATETFGPCGIGWGFNVLSERVEVGEENKKVHIAHVRVWYKYNGEKGEVEHIGGTEFSGKRNSGKGFVDEDAPKKSVTDALIKALSMIGFAGDIFIGRYDDSKYIAELKEEEKANKPKPIDYTVDADNEDQFYEGFQQRLSQMPTVSDVNELCRVQLQSTNRMKKENPDRAAVLKGLVDKRRNELAQKP